MHFKTFPMWQHWNDWWLCVLSREAQSGQFTRISTKKPVAKFPFTFWELCMQRDAAHKVPSSLQQPRLDIHCPLPKARKPHISYLSMGMFCWMDSVPSSFPSLTNRWLFWLYFSLKSYVLLCLHTASHTLCFLLLSLHYLYGSISVRGTWQLVASSSPAELTRRICPKNSCLNS